MLILSTNLLAQPLLRTPNPALFVTEKVQLETPTGSLYGTLEFPSNKTGRIPIALIIAGSGPTDRDGNSAMLGGKNNSLKMLAEGLAARGIASLRYDKRAIGESAVSGSREDLLKFEDYIEDASRWCFQIRADKRFSDVVVIGHSEGSLIGMVAAKRAEVQGFVSIAGAGKAAQAKIMEQLKPQFPKETLDKAEKVIKSLEQGQTSDSIAPTLSSLFRKSVQPYLISWFRYNPQTEIAKLLIPTLILQGTTDIQINLEDAKLLSVGKPDAKLVIIDGMNHVLKEVGNDRDEQISSYSSPKLSIAPKLVNEISNFILNLKK